MRVALLGYGKMGKAIEQELIQQGHQISKIITSSNKHELQHITPETTDVVIEFTNPHEVINNINYCFKMKLPIVVGTTGWYEHFNTIKQHAEEQQQALFYATNFSKGVYLFLKGVQALTQIMKTESTYKPSIQEIHHIQKKDAPSGTAITTANTFLQNQEHYKQWVLDEHQPLLAQQLPIQALRQDQVPGTHTLYFTAENDQIAITHTAFDRSGFVKGAIQAAQWLINKKGVFSMEHLIEEDL